MGCAAIERAVSVRKGKGKGKDGDNGITIVVKLAIGDFIKYCSA